MDTIKKLTFTFFLIQLLHCFCSQETNVDNLPSIVVVRSKNDFSGRLSMGSLIAPDKVLTSRFWIPDEPEPELVVGVNCHKYVYNNKLTDCLSISVRGAYLVLDDDDDDSADQKKIKNIPVLLILENPIESINAVRVATVYDDLDNNNCFYARYEFGQVLTEANGDIYANIKKASYRVSGYIPPFNLNTFISQSRFDLTNIVTDALFDKHSNPQDELFYNFIKRQENRTQINYQHKDGVIDLIDRSPEFVGMPVFCHSKTDESYFQVGLIKSGIWAYITNYQQIQKSILLFYYEDVIGLNNEIY